MQSKRLTIITIAAIVLLIVGIVIVLANDYGWFLPQGQHKGVIEVEDYSEIPVSKEDVVVDDEGTQEILDSILQSKPVDTEYIEKGAVRNGDTVTIRFSGVLEGEEEPFEGGTSDEYVLTLGSGTMIPGFEEGIVGHEIGETFDVHVTFPENYGKEDLAGKDAIFTIGILNQVVYNIPVLTDDDIREYSKKYLPATLSTIDDFKEYIQNKRYKSLLHNAMFQYLQTKSSITQYGFDYINMAKAVSIENIRDYAKEQKVTVGSLVQELGYSSLSEYAAEDAKILAAQAMLIDKLMEDLGLECTDEYFDARLDEYIKGNGYSQQYDVQQFKKQASKAWLWYFQEKYCKKEIAMEALEDLVVLQ